MSVQLSMTGFMLRTKSCYLYHWTTNPPLAPRTMSAQRSITAFGSRTFAGRRLQPEDDGDVLPFVCPHPRCGLPPSPARVSYFWGGSWALLGPDHANLALFLIGSCAKDSDSSEPEAAAPEAHSQATVAIHMHQAPILSSRRCDEFVSVQCLCNMGTHSGASQNRDPEVSNSGVVLRTLFQTLGFLMAGFLLAKITVWCPEIPGFFLNSWQNFGFVCKKSLKS